MCHTGALRSTITRCDDWDSDGKILVRTVVSWWGGGGGGASRRIRGGGVGGDGSWYVITNGGGDGARGGTISRIWKWMSKIFSYENSLYLE